MKCSETQQQQTVSPGQMENESELSIECVDGEEKQRSDEDEDEEATCNPMASNIEECEETDEAFRGDRIGNTVYSESHVLKILLEWIEQLPTYSQSINSSSGEASLGVGQGEENDEPQAPHKLDLDKGLEERMSLLWDMSAEVDVMNFLVENKVFSIIRDTLDQSVSPRLSEIALGILANVISQPSIIEDFTIHDTSLDLVERVVEMCSKVSNVAVLIQVFSVLRRVTWYLRSVAMNKKWSGLLQCLDFIRCANFILTSSRNHLLLVNVIMLFFVLLDSLHHECDGGDEDGKESEDASRPSSTFSIPERTTQLSRNYKPFCDSGFVPALAEGLVELLKSPQPAKLRNCRLTSSRHKPTSTSTTQTRHTDDNNGEEVDVPIPGGHVQQAVFQGLSTLSLLHKSCNGQQVLRDNALNVIHFLLELHRKFSVCSDAVSRSRSLEYFAISLHLLGFCHVALAGVQPEAMIIPVSTAAKLMKQEEKDTNDNMSIRVQLRDGVDLDSVMYIAVVVHEYLCAVADKFGADSVLQVRTTKGNTDFFNILDNVVSKLGQNEDAA